MEGCNSRVAGASEGAEGALIVIGNALPLEGPWAAGEMKLAGAG